MKLCFWIQSLAITKAAFQILINFLFAGTRQATFCIPLGWIEALNL